MMSARTEADCLLDQGALYKSRVLLRLDHDAPIFAGFKAGAFSLYYGDEPIFHFDLEGRWQRAYLDGIHYLKALDTTVRAIDRVREGSNLVLRRRTLGYAEVSDLDQQIRQVALDLIDRLSADRLLRVDPQGESLRLDSETLRDFLERVVLWDAATWFAQRERYLATYPTTPFQPPDGINRVVLQASLGRSRPSTFDRESSNAYQPRSASEFEKHAKDVLRLWGVRIRQARAAYLSGSDILHQPPRDVCAYLSSIARMFPINGASEDATGLGSTAGAARLEGVHAFLEDFPETRPAQEDWKAYRTLHLKRVYLGLESGDPSIRKGYGKQWANQTLVEWVRDVKSADIHISLLLLDDAGGREHAVPHQEATVALLKQLDLGPGDVVALLDGSEVLEGHHHLSNLTAMSHVEHREAQAALRNALRPFQSERKVKVVPYSLDKQWM